MSILGTLSRRHSSVPSKSINACSRIAYDFPSLFDPAADGNRRTRSTRNRCDLSARAREDSLPALEDAFIGSLVAAGQCRQHKANLSGRWQQGTRGWRSTTEQRKSADGGRRYLSTSPSRRQKALADESPEHMQPAPLPEITKDEYKDMVNTYGLPSDMWESPAFTMQSRSRKKNKQPYSLAPRLVVTPEEEDDFPYKQREVLEPEDPQHARNLKKLRRLVFRELGTVSHDSIWKAYQKLQAPRLRYMEDKLIRKMFGQLTWTEYTTDEVARHRYFSLLEECAGEKIPLTETEWTAAIHFAGHAVKNRTNQQVKDAIELWLQMEESGIQAKNVTFNTLFYVAVKAGRFALADTIYGELQSRGMELDRYFRTSMIYYAGLRGEGDAVRKAFNDMVNAGEVIDTAVMNCVILSFIRAGEAAAADHVFRKMNALHEEKFASKGPDDWRGQRKLAQLLNKTGKQLREERKQHQESFFGTTFSGDDRREQIQRASPVAPNARTYRVLLRYYTRVSGELDRTMELLTECKERGFHLHGSVYLNIFTAFIIHGGYAHSAWKPSVLESFWDEFLEATSAPNAGYWLSTGGEGTQTLHFDVAASQDPAEAFAGPPGSMEMEDADDPGLNSVSDEDRAPYFTGSLVGTILRAFHRCMGTPRMLEVWEEIQSRWESRSPDDNDRIEGMISQLQKSDL
ncbi:hypothetical protein Q7P37_009184 [Cladosporium fusiforme]